MNFPFSKQNTRCRCTVEKSPVCCSVFFFFFFFSFFLRLRRSSLIFLPFLFALGGVPPSPTHARPSGAPSLTNPRKAFWSPSPHQPTQGLLEPLPSPTHARPSGVPPLTNPRKASTPSTPSTPTPSLTHHAAMAFFPSPPLFLETDVGEHCSPPPLLSFVGGLVPSSGVCVSPFFPFYLFFLFIFLLMFLGFVWWCLRRSRCTGSAPRLAPPLVAVHLSGFSYRGPPR